MSKRHYVLLATDGYITVPLTAEPCDKSKDKNKEIYIFGFVGGLYMVDDTIVDNRLNWENEGNWPYLISLKGTASIPSPLIWGKVEDDIYITLINLGMPVAQLNDAHTIHLHGAHVATQLDGFPETSFGVPMWMTDSNEPIDTPPTATYYFHPTDPGTMMYHCHVEASEHVQMGMYGALIIYPSKKSLEKAGIRRNKDGEWFYRGVPQPQIPPTASYKNFAYNSIHSYFDKEYIMLLSDIDSEWHESVSIPNNPKPYNAINFKPDFWLINGRAFPHTLLPHPQTNKCECDSKFNRINYESYVHVKTGDMFLLRMINMGYQVVPWHIHGWHFMIIGKDAHLSPFASLAKEPKTNPHELLEHGFTVTIGSGETYDLLLHAEDKRKEYLNYIVDGQDEIPSLCCQISKLPDDASANIPTEPLDCDNPQTVNYADICKDSHSNPNDNFFPQFYPMHNHDDYKVTNYGKYPGGQLTYIQTDAPENHHCDD